MDRWIELAGVVNMRELGGLPLRSGGHTAYGRLLRSDNLRDLTEDSVGHLLDVRGLTDVIDLRTEAEIASEGTGLLAGRVAHHAHSLVRARHDAAGNPIEHGTVDHEERRTWTEHYLSYLRGRPDSVAAALGCIRDARGAALVHCAAGKDRTGTIVALALDVAGVPHEEIVADYALSALRIEAIMERILARPSYARLLAGQTLADQTPRPETMAGLLGAVTEHYGDAAGWLREQGWAEPEIARLRDRLTE